MRTARPVALQADFRHLGDLISTCYFNVSSDTETAFVVVWDLDAHRADARWKDAEGRLDWETIEGYLKEHYPFLLKYLCAVVRSTGGKGLAVAMAISPLEITAATLRAQDAAKAMQIKILELFNYLGMGADSGALGLIRDFCNLFNRKNLVYDGISKISFVQKNSNRFPVVREMLVELNKLDEIGYQRKRDNKTLLYHDARAEAGLALLYEYALNEQSYRNPGMIELTTKRIAEITGLCLPFIRKFLKIEHEWLKSEWLNRADGWRLSITFSPERSQRAYELLTAAKKTERKIAFGGVFLDPEMVTDGSRNEWITEAVLRLKHNAIAQAEALARMKLLVPRIPGYHLSRNCRALTSIVRNIYDRKVHLFGINPRGLPYVLHDVSMPATASYQKNSKANVILLEKGFTPVPLSPVCEKFSLHSGGEGGIPLGGEKAISSEQPIKPLLDGLNLEPKDKISIVREKEGVLFDSSHLIGKILNKAFETSNKHKVNPEIKPLSFSLMGFDRLSPPQRPLKPPRTLKEKNRREFKEKDSIVRFGKAVDRCLARHTREAIISKLESVLQVSVVVKPQINDSYRRLVWSFTRMTLPARLSLLSDLREWSPKVT